MTANEETRVVRTVCPAHCGIDACGILAHVKDGRVIKLEPADFPDPKYRRICLRGLSSLDITYHPDRLKYPMKRTGERGEGKFERISWDDALDTIAEKLKAIADKHGWQAIGWNPGGPGGGTTKFGAYLRLASLTQSTRVSSWGYGDAGLPCGSRVIFGTQFPFGILGRSMGTGADVPDMVVVWGSNPAESAPLVRMRSVMDAKADGARVVVIDPRFTVTASKADEYIGLKPGTDAALGLGLMHVIFKEGLQKDAFLKEYTVGPYLVREDNGKFLREADIGKTESQEYIIWDQVSNGSKNRDVDGTEPALTGTYTVNGLTCKPSFRLLKDLADDYTPEKTAAVTGVPADVIARVGRAMGRAKRIGFITHMGFTRTYHGDISMRTLGTVATVTGQANAKVGSGHQGAFLNWNPFLRAKPDEPSYSRLGILQLYNAAIKGDPFPIKAVWFAFLNFVNQCANSDKIINEVFPSLDLIVTAELFMTPTARYADILLPTTSFLEFSDFVNAPGPYVQLQQKVIEPLYESRSDVDIVSGLAKRLGFGEYFEGGEDGFIDLILDSKHPSLEGITREKLKEGPMATNLIPEEMKDMDTGFKTASGKIEIYSEALVEAGQALPDQLEPLEIPLDPTGRKYPLAFVQGHTRFRTHSSFANVQSLLDLHPEPLVEIHPRDAGRRNISDGDMVTVFNDRGKATLKALLTEGVQPGVVNISEGWWFEQFKEGSVNHLTHDVVNPVQAAVYEPNMAFNDVAVDVRKYEEEGR